MNRTQKSFVFTTIAGLSLGAMLAVIRHKHMAAKTTVEDLSMESQAQGKKSLKARRIANLSGETKEASLPNPSASETANLSNDSSPSGSDPKPFVSLEQKYIAEALKRPRLDEKTWLDPITKRLIKATLVKDDGEYGYVLIKQIFSDQEGLELWGETAQIGDHLMVQFEEAKSDKALEAFQRTHNLSLRKKMLLEGSYLFSSDVVSIDHMEKLKSEIAQLEGVRNSEANYLMFATVLPNDPRLGQLWGFKNDGKSTSGQNNYQQGNDTRVAVAWDSITDCSTTPVAVLDTGIDYNHQDLKDNMYLDKARDFTTNDPQDYMDRQNHGTHCAGSIGAVGNNKVGVAGVCWKAKIVPIKVLGDKGSGSNDWITDALIYASDLDVKILSMSLGGGGASNQMAQAIERNKSKGKLVVIATGNDNKDIDRQPSYPAAYPSDGILAVSAYNGRGDLAGFSNYGVNGADIAAPGEDIMSTVPNNGYASFSGTSMATPITAGIAALLWSAGPKMTAADVRKELLGNADKGNFSKPISDNRKVNIEKALKVLVPKASVANAVKGASISLVNADTFEFQVKNDNPYTEIRKVEVYNGSELLGMGEGEKVVAKIPLSDTGIKVTVKVTDALGKTFTTEVIDMGVDVTKSIDLSAIDVSAHKGDVQCSFVRISEKMEKTVLFEAKVDSQEYCNKLCRIILPTAYTSKGSLNCSPTVSEMTPSPDMSAGEKPMEAKK